VFGDVAAGVARSRPGAALRATSKAPLVFGRPWRVPQAWLADQYRRARDGRFMETTLRSLRTQVGVWGQRRVLLGELPRLSLPALVLWGSSDRVIPVAHGRAAVDRMPAGRLRVLDGLGHLPQVEDPDRVAAELRRFLDDLP
jgi:pimeloyl-ACP methyl ester carboxylesterase